MMIVTVYTWKSDETNISYAVMHDSQENADMWLGNYIDSLKSWEVFGFHGDCAGQVGFERKWLGHGGNS